MTIEHDMPSVVNNHLHDHQDNDSECSYTVPITKDELYQELDELLTAFCSDAQQQFCIDQQVIELNDLERIRQTVQQVQTLLPTVDRNNNLQLRRALSRAIHDILQHYGDACQQRNMRLLDEIATNQYIGDWHRLKQQWELKARENQHIFFILDDITVLTQSWLQHHQNHPDHNNITTAISNKHIVTIPSLSSLPHRLSTAKKRTSTSVTGFHPPPHSHHHHSKTTTTPTSSMSSSLSPSTPSSLSSSSSSSSSSPSSTAADTLASILTTFDYPAGAYTVMVDKSNYGQLGLDHGKIGTRQIIFDSHQLSLNNIIETVNQICDVFASLFAATAHHHLAQIDAQVRKAQPFYTMTHVKRLAARIFCDEDPTTTTMIVEDMPLEVDNKDDEEGGGGGGGGGGATTPHQHYRHASTDSGRSMPIPPRLISTSPSPASPMAVLTPFRLSMTTPHMLWHHPIPIPSFAPAPWQLPDLLKSRYPYNPLFFGLFRRRTSITATTTTTIAKQSSSLLKRAQHYHHSTPHAPMETVMPTKTTSMLRGKKTGFHRSTTPPRPSSTASHATTTTTAATTSAHYPSEEVSDKPASRFLQRHSHSFHRPRHDDDNNDSDNNTKRPVAPFTSVSVDKLSLHLGKMASQFYQDLWMHTRLRYQETQSGLQSLEWQMMDLYRHLQLASSRAVMQRAMMIVQELEDDEGQPHPAPPPQQQHQQQPQQQDRYGQQRHVTKQYGEGDSDTSSDADYEYPLRTDHWTPICTDKVAISNDSNSSSTHTSPPLPPPPLVFHSGTTTATTASSSASQQALHQTCITDTAPSFDDKDTTPTTDALVLTNSPRSSLSPSPGDKQSQMQQQQNNPALSITSSFTTAAS